MEQEDIVRMGSLIGQKRKEQGLTQRELAARLGVTDKAVSKWERGSCCPDIALLMPLSECLGLSVEELLGREEAVQGVFREAADMEDKALEKEKKALCREGRGGKEALNRWLLLGISSVCLLAMLICLLCDYIITRGLGWSYLVCSSVIFGWALLLPFLYKGGLVRSLAVLSLLILPYLAVLERILGQPEVSRIGWPVALISVTGMWCVYFVFRKLPGRVWYAWAITFLLVGGLGFLINVLAAALTESSGWKQEDGIFHVLISVLLALGCAGAGFWKDMKRKLDQKEKK